MKTKLADVPKAGSGLQSSFSIGLQSVVTCADTTPRRAAKAGRSVLVINIVAKKCIDW